MERMNRSMVEALPTRETFAIDIAATKEEGDQFRVTGVMNTFRVTYSGRMLHPAGYAEFLAAHPGASVPMLANHGQINVPYASVGRWDRMELRDGRMHWSGWIGRGTALTDETRMLVSQKILNQLSLGWQTMKRGWVEIGDKSIDDVTRRAMEAAGLDEILLISRYEPVEGSLVDVADDGGARLAAARGGDDLAALKAEIAEIKALLKAPRGDDAAALVERLFAEGENRFMESIERRLSDPERDYARLLLADVADTDQAATCGHAAGVTDKASATLEQLKALIAKL